MLKALPRHSIQRRLKLINIPEEVKFPIMEAYFRWITSCGEDWAVTRMKSLKQDYLNIQANPDAVILTPWVKKKTPRRPSGPMGYLFSHPVTKDIIALFNLFTTSVSEVLTEKQRNKFVKAVTSGGDASAPKYHSMLRVASVSYQNWYDPGIPKKLIMRSPMKESHEKRFLKEFYEDMGTPFGRHIMIDYPTDITSSFLDLCGSYRYPNIDQDKWSIGHIGISQNPGLKARFFAAPHIWIQHMLEPFGKLIYDLVEDLPWDCTYNQDKAFPTVQKHLKDHKRVFSFDLTSATDRFPFDLQLTALKSTFRHSMSKWYIELFNDVARQPWQLEDQIITWKKGQPLGLYPSFATFTYTHGLMLFALNGNRHDDKFFVLGDDVIILDDNLASLYKQFLIDCDVPFEPTKTLESSEFGEFAGKLILPKRIIPSLKWKPITEENVVDFVRDWGMNFLPLANRQARRVIELIAPLPEPWGFGYNPKGLSLSQRCDGVLEHLLDEDKELGFLLSHRELIYKRFSYLSPLALKGSRNRLSDQLDISDASDQEVQRDLEKVLPKLGGLFHLLSKNYYSVNPEANLPLNLLEKSSRFKVSHLTALQRRLRDIL